MSPIARPPQSGQVTCAAAQIRFSLTSALLLESARTERGSLCWTAHASAFSPSLHPLPWLPPPPCTRSLGFLPLPAPAPLASSTCLHPLPRLFPPPCTRSLGFLHLPCRHGAGLGAGQVPDCFTGSQAARGQQGRHRGHLHIQYQRPPAAAAAAARAHAPVLAAGLQ